MPGLVRAQPWVAVGLAVSLLAAIGLIAFLFRYSFKRLRPMTMTGRIAGIALSALVLAPFGYGVQDSGKDGIRDYLGIKYSITTQELNYARNGFTLAFAMNVRRNLPPKPD